MKTRFPWNTRMAEMTVAERADNITAPSALPDRETVIGDGFTWAARWSLRSVAIALGAVLLGLLVKEAWTILLPVFMALIICTVLAPISTFLRNRLRLPPGLAAALAVIGPLAALIGVGFLLTPSVAGQATTLANSTVEGLESVQEWLQTKNFISAAGIDSALQGLQDRIQQSSGEIASGLVTGVTTVSNLLITTVVSLILTFLFLKDGPKFLPWLARLAGDRSGPHLAEVMRRSWATLGGFMRAQALVSLIDAVLIGAGLLIVGVPLAIPLAVLIFFGGFIPIVGAVVTGLVAVLIAVVSVGWEGALIVLAIILIVQQLEGNVLSPYLQGNAMQLHSAVVLLSVLLGSTLFGIVGAFFAVPAAAIGAVIIRYLDEQITAHSRPQHQDTSTSAPSAEPAASEPRTH